MKTNLKTLGLFSILLALFISIIDFFIITNYSKPAQMLLVFFTALAFNIIFWVIISIITYYAFLLFNNIKTKRKCNFNTLFLSLLLNIILFLNIMFIINRRLFKIEWLAKIDVLHIPLRAGFISPKVILANLAIILIAAASIYLFYKLLLKLDQWSDIIAINLFLILVFATKNNHILAGDFNLSKLIINVVIIIIASNIFIALYKKLKIKLASKFKLTATLTIIIVLIFSVNFIANPNPEVNNIVHKQFVESRIILNPVFYLLDFDKDGFVTFLGSPDCNNNNKNINVLAFDLPNDGIDQDCSGSDYGLEDFQFDIIISNDYNLQDYNVVILLLDALRADHLGVYGYDRNTSQNIDKLANNALIYNNLIAASGWTTSSLPSIITGMYPSVHNVYEIRSDKLEEGFTTIFEVLKQNNYKTALFNPYHEGIVKGYESAAQGVDYYYNKFDETQSSEPYLRAELLNEEFYKWFNQKEDGKFFAFVHYGDIHYPYNPPEPYGNLYVEKPGKISLYADALSDNDRKFSIAKYDGAINYLDYEIGGLIEFLKEKGIYNNTIIIITSDHGEEFLEHGDLTHGRQLYREVLNSPFIISAPNKFDGIKYDKLLSGVDIAPTILDLLNIKSNLSFDGISALNDQDKDRYIFSELRNKAFGKNHIVLSLQNAKYHYIFNVESGLEELYDKENDYNELINIAKKEKEISSKMRKILFDWKASQTIKSKEFTKW